MSLLFLVLFLPTLCLFFPFSQQESTLKKLQRPPTNFSSPSTNANTTGWLLEALKDIAYYLRAHKFNEYDRRYEPDAKLARREYYRGFPRPPLRSLHWEVHKFCENSLIDCVNYLRKRIRKAGMKRIDDTAVVVEEQQWDKKNNSKQIEIVDEECRKMKEIDDIEANPFEGPLERFQWRVTASYYLCWYTLKSDPSLAHLRDKCDNFADCLDPEFGANNQDFRADDSVPFACALYSFCPDVCCPFKRLTRPEQCWNTEDNPCFRENREGQRKCKLEKEKNRDFSDIVLNRWNVSCFCPQRGFEWSSFYGICVDIDECSTGKNNCDAETEICLNLPGNYKCACKWGHTYNAKSRKCQRSNALMHLLVQPEEEKEEEKSLTL